MKLDGILGEPCPPMPNVKGKTTGIVGVDPMVLQCADCGSTLTQPEGRGVGVFIITSGWHFHTCEGREGVRRCRSCLEAAIARCEARRCKT